MPEACTVKPADRFTDRTYFRPLIPLLAAFITGIACADLFPGFTWLVSAGIIGSAGTAVYLLYRRENARLSPLFLFFCIGYLALAPWLSSPFSQDHVRYYVDDQIKREISGRIDDILSSRDFRTVCILSRIRLSDPAAQTPPVPVRGKLRMIIYGNPKDLGPGDQVTFNSKIRPFTNFKNPGGFDYIKYMMFRQIWGNAYTSDKKITVRPQETNLKTTLSTVRKTISDLISQASDGDAGAILNALILGNRRQIAAPLQDAFNRAGISHLLAISGLHIGIVASFAFFLFSWMTSRFSWLLQNAWTRKGAAVLSLIPVMIYGILAGMSPSTQRAVVMVSVFLMTFLIEREHDLINTVCVAAMIILIAAPPSLFSVSFQLSFAAVLSIIFGLSRMRKLFLARQSKSKAGHIRPYLAKPILTFMFVSGLAIIGTAPLTMFYFNQVSVAGIISNLIFVPLIGFIVVPAGLFSVLVLLPFSPQLALWGLKACGILLAYSIDWIYRIAGIPFAAVKTITPSITEIICIYALLGSVVYLIFPGASKQPTRIEPVRNKDNRAQPTGNTRRILPYGPLISFLRTMCRIIAKTPEILLSGRNRAWMILGLSLTVMAADISYWVNKRLNTDSLNVSIVDVGQGNAALIEIPGGKVALIDGGGYADNSIFDIGEKVLAPFLWRKKIQTVDTVILTHYDADHANGLAYILKHFNVGQILANHDPATCNKNKEFNEIICNKQISYPPYGTFPKSMKINGVVFNIVYPEENPADLGLKDAWRSSNNNSMVVQVKFGNHAFLFPGDIMKEAENELVALNSSIEATVLVAPHHGSSSSSTPEFIKQVDPQCVVISSGRQNRFGFPAADVLARYEENRMTTYRTDKNGGVCITTDGHQLSVEPQAGKSICITD